MSNNKEHSNPIRKSNIGNFLKEILTGEFFSNRFLLKQTGVIVFAVVLAFIYMNNRMICEQSFKEIDQLRKTLANEKYIAMITESQLLHISRIGTIQELVKSKQLNLIEDNKPAYRLKMTKEE